jgi:hypothetical protein
MRQIISNGQDGIDARAAINDNFIELYNSLQAPIKASNITGNNSFTISANTRIENIFVDVVSGAPTIKIGNVSGGAQLINTRSVNPSYINKFNVEFDYKTSGSLWVFVSGGNINLRIEPKNNLM